MTSPLTQVSIVVPVLREAGAIASCLARLEAHVLDGVGCVFVDGGSTDGTPEIIAKWIERLPNPSAVQCIASAPGRATQMNSGTHACGGHLIFLHADTELPVGAVAAVRSALAAHPHAWGRFDVQIEGHSAWLPAVAWCMNLRSRASGICTGDQAIFMTRAAFDTLGGFPLQPLMEDIEMCKRLKRLAAPACLRQRVRTSGRRWDERGAWRTICLMWRLRWAYWRGADPAALARAYR